MNKNAKAAIAAGAGLLLLLGGGGTFALWNVNGSVDAGTVQSGHLSVDVPDGTWYDTTAFEAAHAAWVTAGSNPATEPELGDYEIADITTWAYVPGSSLDYVIDGIAITAEGKNLKFTVSAAALDEDSDPIDLTGLGFGVSVGSVDFGTVTPSGGLVENSGEWSIAPTAGSVTTSNGTLTVTVDFPSTIGTDDPATPAVDESHMDETLDLSNIAITLQQVA